MVSLSEVAQINPALDRCVLNDGIEVAFVPMRAVAPEGGGLVAPEIRKYGEVKKGYTSFLTGDVIMAKITPCMENGKTTVVPDVSDAVCFGSTEFHVARPESGVSPRWISGFLVQHVTRRAAQRAMTGGVGQMRVPGSFLETIQIPLAPTTEQDRIADEVDELFSDLDAGNAALERVREKLKLYRASVLKAAVQGALTEDWRAKHPKTESASDLLASILAERRRRWEENQLAKFKKAGKEPPKNWRAKYEEPAPPDTTDLPPLPAGWCWASVDQIIASPIMNGISVRGSDQPPGIPALRLSAMSETGFVYEEKRYLPLKPRDVEDLWIEENDFFVSRGNGSKNLVGRGTLAQPPPENVIFPDTMMRLRFMPNRRLTEWVPQVWRSGLVRSQIQRAAKTTAGIWKIAQPDLSRIRLPLPPLPEQTVIVELVDEQLSVIEDLEADIETKLKEAQSLRQSILRHAFTGKLVPQNPKDEPASELLKRITADRADRARQARPARKVRSGRPKKAKKS